MILYSDPKRIRIRGELTKRYYVRCYDSETRRRVWRSTGKTSLKAANEQKRTWESEDARGKKDPAKIRLSVATKAWINSKEAAMTKAGLDTYRGYTKRWHEHFSERSLVRGITTGAVEAYFRKRAKDVSGGTLNRERQALKQLFRWASSRGWCDGDPLSTTRRFQQDKREIRALSEEEEDKLLRACREVYREKRTAVRNAGGRRGKKLSKDKTTWEQRKTPPPWLYPLVFLALRTGLRRGNLEALDWSEVDFARREIRIRASKMKAHEDITIPLDADTVELLCKLKAETSGTRVLPISGRSNVRRTFQRAVKRAKLPETRFHDLRATYISRCRRAGIDVEVVAKLAGHRDIRTTLKFYRRVEESELRQAVEKLTESRRNEIGASEGAPSA